MAATLIRGLRERTRAERMAALQLSSSILSEEEGAELERIIKENC